MTAFETLRRLSFVFVLALAVPALSACGEQSTESQLEQAAEDMKDAAEDGMEAGREALEQ